MKQIGPRPELTRRLGRVMHTPIMVELLWSGQLDRIRDPVYTAGSFEELPEDVRATILKAEQQLREQAEASVGEELGGEVPPER